MLRAPDVDYLIPRIYDVVTAPTQWQTILNEITDSLGARASNIYYGDSQHPELHGALFSDVIAGALEEPENIAVLEAERNLYAAIPEIITTPRITKVADLLRQYDRLGYPPLQLDDLHRWMRDTYGIYHRMTSPLNHRPNYFEFLTLHFGNDCENPAPEFMNQCNRLLPHLAKAIEINRPFALLEARYRAVLEVLDRLQLGVILLGQDQSLWLKNEAANRILENRDSIEIDHHGKLAGKGVAVAKVLDGCFSSLSGETDSSVPKSIRIRLPRAEGQKTAAEAYIADISPLNNGSLDSRAGFAMILVDPDRSGIVNLTNMADLFGLTRSEAAVCDLVVKGYTNNEIADSRNVSPETVITQVKSLFAKTNSHRRGDLIHLAHSVNIPVDPK